MSVATMFSEFIDNLAITNTAAISLRYGEVTCALNKEFRLTDSKTANSLQVGSFGRKTGINQISDLDMIYKMPLSSWDTYSDRGQARLLGDTKAAILSRYPHTTVRIDRCVVAVVYADFRIEVQPAFEQADGSFKYPDTYSGGSWKTTKPREEMEAMSVRDTEKNGNLRRLCKMARAWKNKNGVALGGLLIDTLAYNFLGSTNYFDSKSFAHSDELSRDFFTYLSNLPAQDRYAAPGSNQHVKVKHSFKLKAKKAAELCQTAIDAAGTKGENKKWRKVFGQPFPAGEEVLEAAKSAHRWRNTEQFVERMHFVDIRYPMHIDCAVEQDGWRKQLLRHMLEVGAPLLPGRTLEFRVVEPDFPPGTVFAWKVLNQGEEAYKRDMVRGQIKPGEVRHREPASFKGPHRVECYAILDNVVIARDSITVPIAKNTGEA